jgi:predicted dehydrogenase
MNEKFRWGIIGTGRIAGFFAEGLKALPDAELVAVGSRATETANAFADRFGVPRRHASYEALAEDPDVDAVYVATPHSLHKDNSLLCLRAGKAVLCEKPFTINATEAEELITYARENQVFLMEAMWTRYLPVIVKVRELLAQGVLGEVYLLTADFGYRSVVNPKSRLWAPHLGGGALLDVGVYCVSFASMVFGPPAHIVSLAHLGKTGVDDQAAMILGYDDGKMAVLHTAIRMSTPQEAILMGTEGQIRIHSPFWNPTRATVSIRGQADEVIEDDKVGNGYNYEAAEVGRCVRAGQLESTIMPLDETLAIMRTMDQLRAQWGLKYPMEST